MGNKINWKQKLTSRKLWVTIIGIIIGVAMSFGVGESDYGEIAGKVAGAITAISSIIGYIYGEAKVDAARIDAEERSLMGGGVGNLQDIYDALAGGYARDRGVVKFGHGSKYYADFDVRMHETIANYASLSVTRPDLVKLLHQDKPDLAKALDEAVDELMKKGGIK